jgi:hypothetical protein
VDHIAAIPSTQPPPDNQALEVSEWERSHGVGQSSITSDATPYEQMRNPTNGNFGTEMLTPPDLNQPIYSDTLPFDNLDIEEIWNWMSIDNLDSAHANQNLWD